MKGTCIWGVFFGSDAEGTGVAVLTTPGISR